MTSPNHPHDRESLSALFDGELRGDAARFVHKRLAGDVQWRQACGTWLLAGDVLRGRTVAAAPAGFADRVQLALAQESVAAAHAPAAMVGSRRGWIGGAALAASVAVAAWFVASPVDESTPAAMPAATVATAALARAAPMPPTALAASIALEVAPPVRGEARRTANAGSRPPPRAIAAATAAAAPERTVASVASVASGGIDASALADPFRLPPPQAASRPWPRAVLPHYPVAGALTAGYGASPQNPGVVFSDSPGFYPFEPRLPPATEVATPADSRSP